MINKHTNRCSSSLVTREVDASQDFTVCPLSYQNWESLTISSVRADMSPWVLGHCCWESKLVPLVRKALSYNWTCVRPLSQQLHSPFIDSHSPEGATLPSLLWNRPDLPLCTENIFRTRVASFVWVEKPQYTWPHFFWAKPGFLFPTSPWSRPPLRTSPRRDKIHPFKVNKSVFFSRTITTLSFRNIFITLKGSLSPISRHSPAPWSLALGDH